MRPARAFQVGTASARAVKCGFNFDPAKLKTNYIAYEKQQPGGQDTSKVERIYDVSFNGVAKAVAAEGDYCSPGKTTQIKSDLTRHLAGDYTPNPPKVEEEEGLLSGWGSGSELAGDEGQAPHGQQRLKRALAQALALPALEQRPACSSSSGSKRF